MRVALRCAARVFAVALLAAACGAPQEPERPIAETLVQPAVDGILAAFETHPLVGLGDDHGLTQEMALYAALVRDPRFAQQVGNVVVEFGAGGRQEVIDRYVAGEAVPYEELRTVWTDTVGWIPTAGLLGYAQFFAAVRDANRALAPDERIRVWLGEPPLYWSAVERVEDARPAGRRRDSHPAGIIDGLLSQGEKALVIYGSMHFADPTPLMLGPIPTPFKMNSLRGLVEAEHPGTFFIVLPYTQLHRPAACEPLLAEASQHWPTPALAAPAEGAALEPVLRDCATLDQAEWIERGLISLSGVRPSKVRGDAVLFLGPVESFTRSPSMPDTFLDADYRLEIDRRMRIRMDLPLFPFPDDFSLRRDDYADDLDAAGYVELLDAMFARHDLNRDGVVTAEEYVDPIRR